MTKDEEEKHSKVVMGIIVLGIVFHSVYMLSIFDVYFRSPLVHGMKHFAASIPLSKRIVFIVSDGLRANSFYEMHDESNPMFLHSLIRSNDSVSWGISHTRVPTESRPCHVAMFAGFYEDVSAVTTGWKENPVHFDSVFNQSNYVLQIGSPDVVKIFKGKNMDSLYYEEEMEDFASADPSKLDRWVIDNFEQVLNNDTYVRRLREHDDKVIIFLHLLGADTAGHAYRPSGKGYRETIVNVDQGVKRVTQLVNNFFNDEQTTFIFTADHGMTSKGSHGDGNPECTRTPFVAWGSGIRPANEGGHSIIDDLQNLEEETEYVKRYWKLNPNNRKDIRQADVAPLMAALLGTSYPANNVGTVPQFYIDGSDEIRTRNLFANAQQILEQFLVKEKDKKSKTRFYFRPFPKAPQQLYLANHIASLIEKRDFKTAQEECLRLISISLDGLSYYQTYDWHLLMTIVAVGYSSWVIFLLIQTLLQFTEYSEVAANSKPGSKLFGYAVDALSVVGFLLFNGYLFMEHSPLLYHAYIIFPFVFINYILKHLSHVINFMKSVQTDWLEVFLNGVIYIFVLEVMVIGYFKRGVFSSCFIILGIAPTLIGISVNPRLAWLIVCIFVSLFTLLPADYGSHTSLVCFGGFVIMITQIIRRRFYVHYPVKTSKGRFLFAFQLALICLSSLIVYHTEASLTEKKGLPAQNQIASWVISIVSLILPVFSPDYYKMRIQSLTMALACPFILLSVNYEVMFYAGLDVLMLLWINHEVTARSEDSSKSPTPKRRFIESIDFATALLFIFFINVGFFGTGNLATIASFELTSVYRFVTVFSPFLMTGILFIKIMTPLLITTASFGVILRVTQTSQYGVFFIVLALFDVMTLNFFFLVQDTGSWLEIGNSISRFAIGNIMIVFLLLLFALSQIYTRTVKRSVLDNDNSNNNNNSNINQKIKTN